MRGVAVIYRLTKVQTPYLVLSLVCEFDYTVACVEYVIHPVYFLIFIANVNTIPSRKRAHGRCTLHWAKTGGWADIRGIRIALRRERAPR